jgi:hypothetical protein
VSLLQERNAEFSEPLPKLHAEKQKLQHAKRDVLLMFLAQPTVMMELIVPKIHATSPTENVFTLQWILNVTMETNVPPTNVPIEDVFTFKNNALMTMHVPKIFAILQPETACLLQSAAHAPTVKSEPATRNWDARSPKEYVTTTTHVPLMLVTKELDAHTLQWTKCVMTTIHVPPIDVISNWDA